MCVKEIPTPVHLYFVQLTDPMPGTEPPVPVLCPLDQNQSVYQFSAFVSTISFIEIPISSSQELLGHLHIDLLPQKFARRIVHTSTKPISLSVEPSLLLLLLLLLLLSAA